MFALVRRLPSASKLAAYFKIGRQRIYQPAPLVSVLMRTRNMSAVM